MAIFKQSMVDGRLIGKTKKNRFLTIIVGKRAEKNTYGLITGRPASREERNFYKELEETQGGEQNDKKKK